MGVTTSSSAPKDAPLNWRTAVLFIITVIVIGLCVALLSPFSPAITGAIALAVAVQKPYSWMERHLRHRTLTAAVGVLLTIVLILTPVLLVVQSLGHRVADAASAIQTGSAQDWVTDRISQVPWLDRLVDQALGLVNLRQAAQQTAGFIGNRLKVILTGSVATATQAVLMLFTLFFVLRDHREAAAMFRSILPLTESQRDRLMGRMRNTIEATMQGSVTIAAIQGTLGGIMFSILGVPSAVVWGLTMAILATIPSLGTFLVWMPVAVYLLVSGHWVKAIVLAVWGASVISTVDNVLYPALVGKKMQLHTVPVLFAVLGAIGLFGISGIVLGPLILTTGVTLLRFWNEGTLRMPGESASGHE
ncbi:MAG: AI-2E family transporter [Bryobacteraceae bacterium]